MSLHLGQELESRKQIKRERKSSMGMGEVELEEQMKFLGIEFGHSRSTQASKASRSHISNITAEPSQVAEKSKTKSKSESRYGMFRRPGENESEESEEDGNEEDDEDNDGNEIDDEDEESEGTEEISRSNSHAMVLHHGDTMEYHLYIKMTPYPMSLEQFIVSLLSASLILPHIV